MRAVPPPKIAMNFTVKELFVTVVEILAGVEWKQFSFISRTADQEVIE